MVDSFLASEEEGREFIELEKKKMEMKNEAAINAAIREERFLQVMQQTTLMARQPTPALPHSPNQTVACTTLIPLFAISRKMMTN